MIIRKNIYAVIFASVLAAAVFSGCAKGPDKYELRDAAIGLYQQGDYSGAIEGFRKALDASDGEVSELQYDILKYIGECQIRTGDYAGAKETYSAIVQLDKEEGAEGSRSSEILSELGALDKIADAAELFNEGNYADAYDALSEYAELDGTLTGRAAVYNKAVCCEYMGNYEEAYDLLSAYVNAYPDDAAAVKEFHFCETRK